VASGFEPITGDNRRIIIQEWLVESIAMWSVAATIIAVTAIGSDASIASTVYLVMACVLVAIAIVTALTGARTAVVWFKICPALMTTAAILLIVASVVS
jgi:hypothetical protein